MKNENNGFERGGYLGRVGGERRGRVVGRGGVQQAGRVRVAEAEPAAVQRRHFPHIFELEPSAMLLY